MICPKCSYNRLQIERLYRAELKAGCNDNIDSRIVRCVGCGCEFITQTKITGILKKNLDSQYIYPRTNEELKDETE